MLTPVNLVTKLAHRIFINHNPIDGDTLTSYACGGDEWAKANYKTGKSTVGALDASTLVGVVGDYLNAFQDPENNRVVSFLGNLFNSVSDSLFGYRDEKMYTKLFAKGIDAVNDGEITKDDIKDQLKILKKAPFIDDYMENEHFLKDRVISNFWKWSTQIAKVEAPVYFLAGFLGNKWRSTIFSLTQTFSRGIWRLRFFSGGLHNNFVETAWDLGKSKIMSLFGSQKSREEFGKLSDKVGKMAYEYSEKTNAKDDLGNKTGLSAYLWMLKDRMRQHWRGIKNPEQLLREKIKRREFTEVTDTDREADPNKVLEKGFVNPNSVQDLSTQKRLSTVNFLDPITAGLGLFGTFIFEPLRCVFEVAGIEKGKGVLSFLALSRAPIHLFNYYYKIFLPEKEEGSGYKELEKYVEDGTANEATKMLYEAKKGRYRNYHLGLALLGGNCVETVAQLFSASENRFIKFMFSVLSRFNYVGVTRLFSARRRDQGKSSLVYRAAEIALQKENIGEEEIVNMSQSQREKFSKALEELIGPKGTEEEIKPRFYDGIFAKAGEWFGRAFGPEVNIKSEAA